MSMLCLLGKKVGIDIHTHIHVQYKWALSIHTPQFTITTLQFSYTYNCGMIHDNEIIEKSLASVIRNPSIPSLRNMPAVDTDLEGSPLEIPPTRLQFPPVLKRHIFHCSFHYWYPRYVDHPPHKDLSVHRLQVSICYPKNPRNPAFPAVPRISPLRWHSPAIRRLQL